MSNLRQGLKKLKAKGLKKGSKKKFPDLSGDGKVTMKDILMGRGVVKAGRGDFIASRAQGGAMKKSVDMKKKIGKDRITLYDVQEAQKLLDATLKGTGRGKAKAIESRMKKALGKAQGGMMVKGQGAAIRGTKFEGTF